MSGHLLGAGTRAACLLTLMACTARALWLLAREPRRELALAWADGRVHGVTALSFADALTALCAVVALACALWLSVTTAALVAVSLARALATAHTAAHGSLHPALCRWLRSAHGLTSRLSPRFVQRLVLAGCGLALGTWFAGMPAAADPEGLDLDGLAVPDRAVGHRGGAETSRTTPVAVMQVAVGDSLWSLSERLLPPGATDAETDAAWREVYRRNRAVIGPDPDLILPGTRLQTTRGKEHP